MAATVLFEIKKKRRSPSTKKSPFPLVFHLGSDKSSIVTWQFYRGLLKPDGVEVTSQEDMKNLYHMGYFGKGNLSRSAPRFHYDAEDTDGERPMSYHRFQRHRQLREKAEAQGDPLPNGSAASPKVILVKLPSEDRKESSSDVTVVATAGLRKSVPRILARGSNLKHERSEDVSHKDSSGLCEAEERGAGSGGEGTSDQGDKEAGNGKEVKRVEADDGGPDVYECDSSGERIIDSEEVQMHPAPPEPQSVDDGSNDIIEVDSQTGMEVAGEDIEAPTTSGEKAEDRGAGGDKAAVESEEYAVVTDGGESKSGCDSSEVTIPNQQEDEDSKKGLLEVLCDAPSEALSGGGQEGRQCTQESRPRRRAEEGDGCTASDGDEIEMVGNVASTSDNEDPEVFAAEDPWPFIESLQLFFEEAYFLSYGLGCLIVKDGDEDLELLKLWQKLCALCDNFPARYAAYHHFRSKGWVVRAGSKFAADYLLYKDGPPFYHASFSVVVRQVWADNLEEHSDHRLRNWPALSGLIRVNGNASKTVLLCHVIMPRDADLSTPNCLRLFKIQELLVRRWITSEEREKRDDAS
uniref:tRNA-intron lyase n=1 Tax=Amblyomma aureolatum TaxID=187763 RepID=A0A1E1XDB0_9ACAR